MKHQHLRKVIVLGVIVISCLMVVQIFWFRRAFDISERQFDHSVQVALKGVSDSILNENKAPAEIKKLSSNFFFVRMNTTLNPTEIDSLIQKAFSKHKLTIDYELGIYNAHDDTIVYGNYIQSTKAQLIEEDIANGYDDTSEERNFAVYFPGKTSYLASELKIWIFSSVALLLMIGFFAYAIWSLLREKRFAEIKNEFINNMTHELKTPVTNIHIAHNMLSKKFAEDPAAATYLDIIDKENQKLQQRINRVLQSATVERNQAQTHYEKVDIHDILKSCAETFRMKINQKKGKLFLELNAHQSEFYGDKEKLTEVFNNIIDNAEKYTRERPEITIRSNNKDNVIQLIVKDNGIGIPEPFQKRVFDKFFRVQQGNVHNVKGFGLGLNIVKSIINAHHGTISLKSKANTGTEVAITFPL